MVEESIVINCRHCNTQNKILKSKAINNIAIAVCGECRKSLFYTQDEAFSDLSSKSYEHPLDKSALEALKKVPGTGTVLKFIIKHTFERYYRLLFIQNFIKVTPKHHSSIYDLAQHGVKILDIEKIPEVFIYQSPFPNAFTAGVDSPYIGISTSLIDLLDEEELLGVIAHELGHIQSGHVLYKTAAHILAQLVVPLLVNILGMGIGQIALMAIVQAFLYWDRCSELSADRAEILVTKSFKTSIYTTMKLASGSQKTIKNMDMDEFLLQAEEAKQMKEENIFNNIMITIQSSSVTHPFPVWRAGHLKEWVYEGDFLNILQGNYAKRSAEGSDKDFKEDDFKKAEDEPGLIDNLKKIIGI